MIGSYAISVSKIAKHNGVAEALIVFLMRLRVVKSESVSAKDVDHYTSRLKNE